MEKMEIFKKIGSWLFLMGIVVAVLVGIIVGAEWYVDTNSYMAALLGVLGFIVGILSFFALGQITKERVPTFLIAALTLLAIGALSPWTFGSWEGLAPYLTGITQYMAIFAAPAAGLLAIRAIWDAGKTEDIEKIIPKIQK